MTRVRLPQTLTPLLLTALAAVSADEGSQRNHASRGSTVLNTGRTQGGAPGYGAAPGGLRGGSTVSGAGGRYTVGGFGRSRHGGLDFNGVASQFTPVQGQYSSGGFSGGGSGYSGGGNGYSKDGSGFSGGASRFSGGLGGFGRENGRFNGARDGFNRAQRQFEGVSSGFNGGDSGFSGPGAGFNNAIAGVNEVNGGLRGGGGLTTNRGIIGQNIGHNKGAVGFNDGGFGGIGSGHIPDGVTRGRYFGGSHVGGHSAFGGYTTPGAQNSAVGGLGDAGGRDESGLGRYFDIEALLGGKSGDEEYGAAGGRFGRESPRFRGFHIGGHTPFGGYSPPGTYGRKTEDEDEEGSSE